MVVIHRRVGRQVDGFANDRPEAVREVVMDDRVRRELEISEDEIDIPEFLKED